MDREVNNPDQREDSPTDEGDSVCLGSPTEVVQNVTSGEKVAFLDKLVARGL